MKKLIFILVFVLLSSVVFADEAFQRYLGDLEHTQSEFNANLYKVPGFMKRIAGNERVNVNVELDNGSVAVVGVVTKKGAIIEIMYGNVENYTLEINTTEKTISQIMKSKKQVKDLIRAMKGKRIVYKAVKFRTKTKMFLAKSFMGLRYWF